MTVEEVGFKPYYTHICRPLAPPALPCQCVNPSLPLLTCEAQGEKFPLPEPGRGLLPEDSFPPMGLWESRWGGGGVGVVESCCIQCTALVNTCGDRCTHNGELVHVCPSQMLVPHPPLVGAVRQ